MGDDLKPFDHLWVLCSLSIERKGLCCAQARYNTTPVLAGSHKKEKFD